MVDAKYRFLEGGPGRHSGNKNYNQPERISQRHELYSQLAQVIKRKRMLDYDRYRVLCLIIRKIREGTL